jgi:tripartite-type tricarboxylate transporter receptor subunit TctC
MTLNRRQIVGGLIGLPLTSGVPISTLRAQESWPNRIVTIVVPFPPGGAADIAGRLIAAVLTKKLGRMFIVENKPGAGGGLGHAYVASAKPDGYTLMMTLPSLAVIPEANRLQGQNVYYEANQFSPIARISADPQLLVVKKFAPWKRLEDLVADARNNPGKIAYASSGRFGAAHIPMEMFLNVAGIKMLHVPYQGGFPAFNALLSDQVQVCPTVESIIKGHLTSGAVRVLAQWGTKRTPDFQNVPTMQEVGYSDVVNYLWTGLFAPVKTPEPIIKSVCDVLGPYMHNPETIARFAAAGSTAAYLDSSEFEAYFKDDARHLIEVVRKIGLS